MSSRKYGNGEAEARNRDAVTDEKRRRKDKGRRVSNAKLDELITNIDSQLAGLATKLGSPTGVYGSSKAVIAAEQQQGKTTESRRPPALGGDNWDTDELLQEVEGGGQVRHQSILEASASEVSLGGGGAGHSPAAARSRRGSIGSNPATSPSSKKMWGSSRVSPSNEDGGPGHLTMALSAGIAHESSGIPLERLNEDELGDIVREAEQKQARLEKKQAAAKLRVMGGQGHERHWRKDRNQIDWHMFWNALAAAVLANCGTACAIIQNEMVLANARAPGADPILDYLKLANSGLTLASLFMLLRYHTGGALHGRVDRHLAKGYKLTTDSAVFETMRRKWLWVELFLVGIHCPPWVTFESTYSTMHLVVVHRGESVLCLVNTLRIYLFWRVMKYLTFLTFPRRHTIARLWVVGLDSGFAFKILISDWWSMMYIAAFWTLYIAGAGYWFRTFESTMCMYHPKVTLHEACELPGAKEWLVGGNNVIPTDMVYLQDSLWAIFVTSTTVGYGDIVPYTHMGRVVAAISGLVGVLLASLLIASLSNVMTFSNNEQIAVALFHREWARRDLRDKAGWMIHMWWARHLQRKHGKPFRMDVFLIKREFHMCRQQATKSLEECAGHLTQVDNMSKRSREGKKLVTELAEFMFLNEIQEREGEGGGTPSASGTPSANKKEKGWGHVDGKEMADVAVQVQRRLQERRAEMELLERSNFKKLVSLLPGAWEQVGSKWKQNPEIAQRKSVVAVHSLTFFGCFGLVCSVAGNELIFGRSPTDGTSVIFFKMMNSASTIIAVVWLVQYYWVKEIYHTARHNLDNGLMGDVKVGLKQVLRKTLFWVELIWIGIHLPPYITFEAGYMTKSKYTMHRGETIMCVWNTTRLYLLARSFREVVLSRLPKRDQIARMSQAKIGSSFAAKLCLNSWESGLYITGFWFSSLLLLSYWYRSADISGCLLPSVSPNNVKCKADLELHGNVTNDLELSNSLWFNMVTTLTVGYGDVTPSSHLARGIASIMAILGITCTSLLAAALAQVLAYTSDEASAMMLLNREKARKKIMDHAASILQHFWLVHKKAHISARREQRIKESKRSFVDLLQTVKAGVDDCADVESKIGTMNLDTHYMIQGLELMLSRLKMARAEGWNLPSGDEYKAFAVTMDETMCTNDVEHHLFRRIFAIAAYKEAKAKGLHISTAFSIATRARKKLKDATAKHKFKKKAKLVMLARSLAKTTSTKAPKPPPANTAPEEKMDTEGSPITGVAVAAAKKFSVASSKSNGHSFLVGNTGISPFPPSAGASPISQLTAARGGGPEQ